jgi:release factor glutamine methyltransferase
VSATTPPPASVVARLRAAGCVFAEDEAALLVEAAGSPAELDRLVGERCSGLPLEQVLGWASFCGLRIAVEPGVFVPRRRSELLAREAVRRARAVPGRPVVVDLCCGSAALGVAVASEVRVELHVADVDPRAVACARRNVEPLGGHAHVGDLFHALPPRLRGRVDLLVVNAPYVPTGAIATMPPEARDHEPRVALDGGADGVGVQRRVSADAAAWLAPGGRLLLETSRGQVAATVAALAAGGLTADVLRDDDLDATAVVGTPVSSPPGR